MGGVVSIKGTSKSLLNIRYLRICTRWAYDNEPTFCSVRTIDWSPLVYLIDIFGVRALFLNGISTAHRQLETVKFHDFWRNAWTSFPFYLSAKGFTILCCCFFVDSSKGTDSPTVCRVCVCVFLFPRLFNVFFPIWDRLNFFILRWAISSSCTNLKSFSI